MSNENKPMPPALDQNSRHEEIDWLKAAAILSVILIHAISNRAFTVDHPLESWLGDWTRFAVPTFLFASGFLFPKKLTISSWTILSKFVVRIGPPYLFCSFIMMLFKTQFEWMLPYGEFLDWENILRRLLLGQAIGIYYYIFVLSYLTLAGLVLRVLNHRLLYAFTLLSFGLMIPFYAQWFDFFIPNNSWQLLVFLRHPVIYCGHFLAGWVISLHWQKCSIKMKSWPATIWILILFSDILLLCLLSVIPFDTLWRQFLVLLHIYLTIMLILKLSWTLNSWSQAVKTLAEASYGIFLIHVVFVLWAQSWFKDYWNGSVPWRILVPFLFGVLGSWAIRALSQKYLGKYSRLFFGF